tara:strand:+ start:403 stop:675 length:273 start_codon:yes stop_codon:yes gene_type:complete
MITVELNERTMLVVRCKQCNKEVKEGDHSCGCPNMLLVKGDTFTASDLSKTIIVTDSKKRGKKDGLTESDLAWQEQRRKRKVRKLNFEIR